MSRKLQKIETDDRKKFYGYMAVKIEAFLCEEKDALANLSNAAAILGFLMERINWVGFYLRRGEELVLGPFQGKPACTRIPLSRGVCGAAATSGQIQVVPDVNLFPGHIACDEESASEIVVPLFVGERVVGVLDIDSPVKNRFDMEDAAGLQRVVSALGKYVCWDELTFR